jgi:hypothetical protein
MNQIVHEAFAAFVGLDWADAKHEGCLQAAGAMDVTDRGRRRRLDVKVATPQGFNPLNWRQ